MCTILRDKSSSHQVCYMLFLLFHIISSVKKKDDSGLRKYVVLSFIISQTSFHSFPYTKLHYQFKINDALNNLSCSEALTTYCACDIVFFQCLFPVYEMLLQNLALLKYEHSNKLHLPRKCDIAKQSPRSRVLLEKLIVHTVDQEIFCLYGT